jgi:AraC family transcriptional regulator
VGLFGSVEEEGGVVVTSADANGFQLAEIRFPAGYVQARFEPDLAYLAVVLEGCLEKSFGFRSLPLANVALSMPVGASHSACFGVDGARVVIVKPKRDWNAPAGCLERLVELRGGGYAWLGWRLAGELRASDDAAPLAAEAVALELLAAASRETAGERRRGHRPAWLRAAEELLRTRERIGVGVVADAVGVHPAHLARVFRQRHGISVGDYARRVRLEWAAAQLARTDEPVAVVAAEAGFADQSHFTRRFKQFAGITPARYRDEVQRGSAGAV